MLYNEQRGPQTTPYAKMERNDVSYIQEAGKRYRYLLGLSKQSKGTAALTYGQAARELKEEIYQKYQIIL
jgi:hypothetical protein